MKHKFINKKTGAEARVVAMYLDSDRVMQVDGYDTVEDLMNDYAAYEKYEPPKEPHVELAKKEPRKEESPDLVTWEFIAEELKKMHAPETAELCGEEEE